MTLASKVYGHIMDHENATLTDLVIATRTNSQRVRYATKLLESLGLININIINNRLIFNAVRV